MVRLCRCNRASLLGIPQSRQEGAAALAAMICELRWPLVELDLTACGMTGKARRTALGGEVWDVSALGVRVIDISPLGGGWWRSRQRGRRESRSARMSRAVCRHRPATAELPWRVGRPWVRMPGSWRTAGG